MVKLLKLFLSGIHPTKIFKFTSMKNTFKFSILLIIAAAICFGFIIINKNGFMNNTNKVYRMLSIGDSYTIGEGMKPEDRFPNQTISMLKSSGINFDEPKIIAKTGWTTDELMAAIKEENPKSDYDFVTLLIGVNNQYRERSIEEYQSDFKKLLAMSIGFAQGKSNHVIVLSIPDWGFTPFADGRDRNKIAEEIDVFNSINKKETEALKAHYIDITPGSRKAANDLSLVAEDKLHPSAKMYKDWAKLVADVIKSELK
jgi:lysophospholipase L1-like esterase